MLAVDKIGLGEFAIDPVIDFERENRLDGIISHQEVVAGQTIDMSFRYSATLWESAADNPDIPDISGGHASMFGSPLAAPPTITIDFETDLTRIGFNFGLEYYLGNGVDIRLFDRHGEDLGSQHFEPHVVFLEDFTAYGFAGVESDVPFARALIRTTMNEIPAPHIYGIRLDNLRFGPISAVAAFSNTTNIADLYVDFDGAASESIAFYRSVDGGFDKNSDELILQTNVPAAGLSNIPGGQRLTFNPASGVWAALKTALEDENVAMIFAVGNPDSDDPSSVPFRGFYQADSSQRAVVRPGPATKDTVTLSPNTLAMHAEDAGGVVVKSSSATFSDASDVLIVTGDLDDKIVVTSTWDNNLIVQAGTEIDELDFSSFSSPVRVDISETSSQQLTASGITLRLPTANSIENVTGSNFNDRIVGNSLKNIIKGRTGDDILIGGAGVDDELYGDDDDDAILGDGFTLSYDSWTGALDALAAYLDGGALALGVEVSPLPGAKDIVRGGAGDDLIIGGDGGDDIDAESGKSLIFGDSFYAKANISLDLSGIEADISKLGELFSSTLDFGLVGDGDDTIVAGTLGSIVHGGGGVDAITGSDTAGSVNVLIGGDGQDPITARNGTNLIIGGNNTDTITGGAGFNVIVGGTIGFGGGDAIPLQSQSTLRGSLALLEKVLGRMTLPASGGGDIITGGTGTNIILGTDAPDTITGGDTAAGLDLLFGFGSSDKIIGKNGHNLIVGGDEGDEELRGGDMGNVIIGENLELSGFSIDLDKLLSGQVFEAIGIPQFQVTGVGATDHIYGGGGFDFLVGGRGADHMEGGDGLNIAFGDQISLQAGGVVGVLQNFFTLAADIASIGAGNPATVKNRVNDFLQDMGDIFENLFSDTSDLRDEYSGGNGIDIAFGGGGNDELEGGLGTDFLVGGFGDDTFQVQPNGPFIEDDLVNDFAHGGFGNDTFYGGSGNDFMSSTEGNDIFIGRDGDDILIAGNGTDSLYGGSGNDYLDGEAGDDILVPGAGDNTINDNQGSNRIVIGADYDGSGAINQADHSVWASSFGSSLDLSADGNGDGVINAADYVVWRDNRGGSPNGSAASLPMSDSGSLTRSIEHGVLAAADGKSSETNIEPQRIAAPRFLKDTAQAIADRSAVAQFPFEGDLRQRELALLTFLEPPLKSRNSILERDRFDAETVDEVFRADWQHRPWLASAVTN